MNHLFRPLPPPPTQKNILNFVFHYVLILCTLFTASLFTDIRRHKLLTVCIAVMYLDELIYFPRTWRSVRQICGSVCIKCMSRRCPAKPGATARDLFIRDLFIGGKFEKDIQLLWENLKKSIVFKLKNQKKQTKFHKSQIEIINEGNLLTN